MPGYAAKPCNYPGCSTLVRDGSGKCGKHQSASGWADKARGTRHERGYGNAWDRLRLGILRRDDYLCQCPECQGGTLRLRLANEVDHIKPKAQGGDDSPDNLRAVNAECHRRITAEQRKGG